MCASVSITNSPTVRDHAGGNEMLRQEFRDLAVYGGAKDSVPGVTQ